MQSLLIILLCIKIVMLVSSVYLLFFIGTDAVAINHSAVYQNSYARFICLSLIFYWYRCSRY
ncbi:MAG: hypothetical protein Q7U21_09360, partial [Lutibacter sp.]|nr:hypothetical protein [Lutibacter sp.]